MLFVNDYYYCFIFINFKKHSFTTRIKKVFSAWYQPEGAVFPIELFNIPSLLASREWASRWHKKKQISLTPKNFGKRVSGPIYKDSCCRHESPLTRNGRFSFVERD